ncbi:MAG: regulatory iron-sulfur-containing complex subunit RicT [Phycisphaerales bacterium]
MAILPLPQFEADLKADLETYQQLQPPKSIVVRFGVMRLVGEFFYDGDAKPGCGSKLVARTHRGTELCEMLTTTCSNSGCSKSVSRKEMLDYIDNSGGRDYPFFQDGKVLRVATIEDLNGQSAIEARKPEHIRRAREAAQRLRLPMKIADAEEILGGERITFYFTSLSDDEHARIDFRPLVMDLAAHYRTRIEMRQVGARDEARLTADYERCGQHCCCKQFLKVLKPVSMKQAKIQKATLDPLKISGRCGRLMCCLRYEESTYDDLRKRLPKKKVRVRSPDGFGIVLDTQILTQLVLVLNEHTGEQAAYPLEQLDVGGAVFTDPPPAPPRPPPAPSAGGAPPRGGPRDGRDDRGRGGPGGSGGPPRGPGGDRGQPRGGPRDARGPRDQQQRPRDPGQQGPRERDPRDRGPREQGPRDPREQGPRDRGPRDGGGRAEDRRPGPPPPAPPASSGPDQPPGDAPPS